ncbi:hypothetical protein EMPG_11300 [Blastomyces silverae]|uniref:Myb-like DNA-binding domain-containing protein n=1 Tax=Blastomyces silverae TaxID=2060906 RepID=A0A0H1BR74_9EURO|nr:hypothetical protein EMPG_11300 [Blastomyces silverae]
MPSKTQADVNLWFLYTCLQKSDYKTIDFNAVGEATSLNPPAARMRFSRLKKAIETGTTNPTVSPERASQYIGIVGKSKQQGKSGQRDSKGVTIKKENQMQNSGYPIDNPIMADTEMGIESYPMIYNQQGIGANCASGPYEADDGDTDDDDIPLATKRKAAQYRETNKRQKQMSVSCPAGIKDEPAANDTNHAETHGPNDTVPNDELMALDSIPSRDACKQIPYSHRYITTNMSMTLAPPAPTTTLQDMAPGYISAFTNDNKNNNQFTSRGPQQHDFSYDPYWSSWPSTVSRMTHPRDPSAARSLPARTSGYVRSPGIGQNNSITPWTKYRIPNITITDTDPYGVRNPLCPGSTNAVDKVQMAINEALFSPRSQAFDRSYAGTMETNDVSTRLDNDWCCYGGGN